MGNLLKLNMLEPTFQPSSISGLRVWLDADDASTITESGGAVSQWDNKGNGNNFTQGTGSAQPATSASTLNGRNVLDFTLDFMSGSFFPVHSDAGLTIFIVGKTTTADQGMYFSQFSGGPFGTFFSGHVGSDRQDFVTNGGSGTRSHKPGVWPLDTWNIITNTYDNSVMGTYREGILLGTTVQAPPLDAASGSVAVGSNRSGDFRMTGSIAEIIAYDRILLSIVQTQVEFYLRNKWRTPA